MGKQFWRRGTGREKQMPKCSSSADRWSRWLTCLLIKSSCFRRLSQGYCENATHSAKIWSEWLQGPVWTPSYWAEAADTAGWTLLFFSFIFFSHETETLYFGKWDLWNAVNCPVLPFHSLWGPPKQLSPLDCCSLFFGCQWLCLPKSRAWSQLCSSHPSFLGDFFPWRQLKHPENGTRIPSPPQIWV